MADVPHSEWHPTHELDRVEVTMRFPDDGSVELRAAGYASTKRGALWRFQEDFLIDQGSMAAHDAAAHLLLVVQQDRPNTRERLDFGLMGGLGWEDQELPFT